MVLPQHSGNDVSVQEVCNKGEKESRTDQRQRENLMEVLALS